MIRFSRALPRPRLASLAALPLIVAMLALGSIVFLTQSTKSMAPANAVPLMAARVTASVHGTGISIRGQWFGTWRTPHGRGFCIEFDKGHPNSSGVVRADGRLPGMSSESSARIKYLANRYGNTTSKVDAVAVAIYVWKLQNTARFRTYYAGLLKQKLVSTQIQRRVGQIAAESANYGPYRVTMSLGAGFVGQSVNGTVAVRAKNGKPVSGMRIALAATNGTVTRAAPATNAAGRSPFTVRITRLGALRVDGRLTTPAANVGWITRPTAGHQRLALAGRSTETARTTAATQRQVGRPTVASACSGDCKGQAPVTVSMSNPRGSATLREYIYSNNRLVGSVDVPAGTTKRKSLQLPDGARVTTRFCYLNGRNCISAPKANAGTLVVDCPPMVEYRYVGSCPCDTVKTITYQVLAPAGVRRDYFATLTTVPASGKSTTSTLRLTQGTWQSFAAVKLARGTRVDLSFRVGKQNVLLDRSTQNS